MSPGAQIVNATGPKIGLAENRGTFHLASGGRRAVAFGQEKKNMELFESKCPSGYSNSEHMKTQCRHNLCVSFRFIGTSYIFGANKKTLQSPYKVSTLGQAFWWLKR